LPGDYNRDFTVDAADFTAWRDMLGERVTPYWGGDGDGDGRITVADYGVWAREYGASNAIPAADYNGDGAVNAADFTVWRDQLGMTGFGLATPGHGEEIPKPGERQGHRDAPVTFCRFGFLPNPSRIRFTACSLPAIVTAVAFSLSHGFLLPARRTRLSPLRTHDGRLAQWACV